MQPVENSQIVSFKITVMVGKDGDGYHAYCPAFKGLHVDGKTKAEALRNAQRAAQCYLDSLIREGDPLPLGPDLAVIPKQPIKVPAGVMAHSLTLQWGSHQMSGGRSRI